MFVYEITFGTSHGFLSSCIYIIAFDKECLHNAVAFKNFRQFIDTYLGPPKNYSGANDVIALTMCFVSDGSPFCLACCPAVCSYQVKLLAFGILGKPVVLLCGLLSGKLHCLCLKVELLAFGILQKHYEAYRCSFASFLAGVNKFHLQGFFQT